MPPAGSESRTTWSYSLRYRGSFGFVLQVAALPVFGDTRAPGIFMERQSASESMPNLKQVQLALRITQRQRHLGSLAA
jgi:hypothetical protein